MGQELFLLTDGRGNEHVAVLLQTAVIREELLYFASLTFRAIVTRKRIIERLGPAEKDEIADVIKKFLDNHKVPESHDDSEPGSQLPF